MLSLLRANPEIIAIIEHCRERRQGKVVVLKKTNYMTSNLEKLLQCLKHIYSHFESRRMPAINNLSLNEALPESDQEPPESDRGSARESTRDTLESDTDTLRELLEVAVRTMFPLFTTLTTLEKKLKKQ